MKWYVTLPAPVPGDELRRFGSHPRNAPPARFSGIRKVFALAADLKDPVNLSIGQPHFDIPDEVKDVALEAIRAGKNAYTQTAGLTELREKIKQHYRNKGLDLEGEVMVTSGVSGGILLTFLALLDEGDEIIIPDPYFVVQAFVQLSTSLSMWTPTRISNSIRKIARHITPRTKAILPNSPCNPRARSIQPKP